MTLSIAGATAANILEVDATFKAARASLRPPEAVGWYSVGVKSGALTGLAAGAPIFSLRNLASNVLMIRRIGIGFLTTTSFAVSQICDFGLTGARAFTASDSGGNAVALTGTNNNKHRTALAAPTAKLMDESKATTAEVVVRGTLEPDAAGPGRGGWPTYTMTVTEVYKTSKDVKIEVGQKLTVKTIKELTGMVTLYLVFDKDQNRYRLQDPHGKRGFSHVGGRTSFALSLDKAEVGEFPKGWVAAKTGEGPGSVWKVMEDKKGKKVLAQTSNEGRSPFFNLCVAESTSFTDIDLTVAFKAKAGKLDQGGGLSHGKRMCAAELLLVFVPGGGAFERGIVGQNRGALGQSDR